MESQTHLTQKDFYYHGYELKVRIYAFDSNGSQTPNPLLKERMTGVTHEDLGMKIKIIDSEDEDEVEDIKDTTPEPSIK